MAPKTGKGTYDSTDRHRQTDSYIERQTDRYTERQTDRDIQKKEVASKEIQERGEPGMDKDLSTNSRSDLETAPTSNEPATPIYVYIAFVITNYQVFKPVNLRWSKNCK